MDIDFLQRDPSRRSRNTLRRKVSQSRSTLSRRSRSLNRPDRAQENINNNTGTILASSSATKRRSEKGSSYPGPWTFSSWVLSCCFPTPLLNAVGIRGHGPVQAWREKFALCVIVALMSGFVVFFNLFFQSVLCPDPNVPRAPKGDTFGTLNIRGRLYNTSTAIQPYLATWDPLSRRSPGADISSQFTQPEMPSCAKLSNSFASLRFPCEVNVTCLSLTSLASGRYGLSMITTATDYRGQVKNLTSLTPAYSWDVLNNSTILVVRGMIYNLAAYYRQYPDPIANDRADTLLRKASAQLDGTIHFQAASSSLRDSVLSCLSEKYQIGVVDQEPVECISTNVVVLLVYAMILAVTLIRFVLSVFFSWFIAGRLARDPAKRILESDPYKEFKAPVPALRHSTLPTDSDSTVFVEGGGVVAPAYSAVPPASGADSPHSPPRKAPSVASLSTISNPPAPAVADSDLYVSLLVTCYSENEDSLRATIESLALTEYNNAKKLLFIVADGIITGKGNAKSTPDILIDMLELDPVIGRDPKPFAYQAVGHDHKKYNMAKVYCGHYVVNDRRVPAVLVVKCGSAAEAESSAKPGNRGKRDSQLVLMNFFNRVMLNEKMTPLDYDMFRKVHHLTGVTPDYYELVLMVDADTYVEPDSLRKMVNCMHNDQRIMGLCGETKIANKRQSWVTAIQVFEYYMSHHLGKAFESTFGGVTCLPGCFCMYRIKARKAGLFDDDGEDHDPIDELRGGYTSADVEKRAIAMALAHKGHGKRVSSLSKVDSQQMLVIPGGASAHETDLLAKWTPILVSPKILEEYCTDDVDTLHHKNLLMLGEDRFLSTLMLRHFPKRRMMFVPSAVCRTVVPERFGTLLSQRRRWINSTVHNLMELVKVNNLCGTFCFSMQFVVFLDLIGTAVFPASLVITYIMIVESAITGYKSVPQFLPTILLICVIFLPAVLCVLTSRGPVINHLMWMCVYLLSLPIWQIVLPLYSFWHFDDFSWGATRKVDGVDGRGATMVRSGKKEKVIFRKWEEYEIAWRLAMMSEGMKKKGVEGDREGQQQQVQPPPQQQQQQPPMMTGPPGPGWIPIATGLVPVTSGGPIPVLRPVGYGPPPPQFQTMVPPRHAVPLPGNYASPYMHTLARMQQYQQSALAAPMGLTRQQTVAVQALPPSFGYDIDLEFSEPGTPVTASGDVTRENTFVPRAVRSAAVFGNAETVRGEAASRPSTSSVESRPEVPTRKVGVQRVSFEVPPRRSSLEIASSQGSGASAGSKRTSVKSPGILGVLGGGGQGVGSGARYSVLEDLDEE